LIIHAPRISDEVIETNDVVELVNENQFVFPFGRIDNVINSGGIKLLPEQKKKLAGKIEHVIFLISTEDKEL
jgi:O-succinylbenzoic acid--CoA ligase